MNKLYFIGFLFLFSLSFVEASSWISPTPNGLTNSMIINASINPNPLTSLIWNWNGTNYSQYDNTLLAMLNFDNYTRMNDTSLYGNNGTCTGGGANCPNWTSAGKYGGAYQFDGLSTHISMSNNSIFSIVNGTIEAWIKTTNSGSGYRGIISRQYHYSMFLKSNELGLYDWSTSTWRGSGSLLNDNNWHQVTVVFQSGVAKGSTFYVDGRANGTTTMTIVAGHLDESFNIGMNQLNGNGQNFNGSIDEVRIWNRTLSSNEVTQLYKSNLAKFNATDWLFTSNQTTNVTGNYIFDLFVNGTSIGQRSITYALSWSPIGMFSIIPDGIYVQLNKSINKKCIYVQLNSSLYT